MRLTATEPEIDLTVEVIDTLIHISVTDRGPEMPEEKRLSIFEPYSVNDRSSQRDAGLGLAVCRAIAKVHGGSLALYARRAGGSTFRLSLPFGDQPSNLGVGIPLMGSSA